MQLAQVRDPRVGGEVRLAVDHRLQLALGVVVAAELDERVDAHERALRCRRGAPSTSAPPKSWRASASSPAVASAVGRARRPQDALGAGVEGRVAGLAHPLQVGGGQRGAQVLALGDRRTALCSAGMSADVPVSTGRCDRGRRRGPAALESEDGEAGAERERDERSSASVI